MFKGFADLRLYRQQQELERMATAFDQSWEEQLWRLRIEQEVFSCQRADVNTLRNELKHLSQVIVIYLTYKTYNILNTACHNQIRLRFASTIHIL